MKYKYFVAFAHERGFGNATMTRESKIDSFEDLREMAEEIEKQENIAKAVVINFILLEELRVDENYISKDKIKEKIEEVKSRKCGDVFDLQAFMYEQEVIIEELEELLKGE